MYVDAISDQGDLTDFFSADEKRVNWHGHEVYKLQDDRLTVFHTSDLSKSKLYLSGKQIKPMMSGGAKVSGEVDQDGKFALKVEVSAQWGGSSSNDRGGNETSSSENAPSENPPAPAEEDFEKK